jgi:hypothetical protein
MPGDGPAIEVWAFGPIDQAGGASYARHALSVRGPKQQFSLLSRNSMKGETL